MIQEEKEQYNGKVIEARVDQFWNSTDAYHKTRALRKGNKKFYFVDGPPYTTGRIHLGTAWNKIIKDSVLRYRSMNGFDLMDRAGWDMHGLPIEVKVESLLGFKTKKDIENYGVAQFTEKCKAFAIENMREMTGQFKKLGVWLDWDDPYMTLKNEYIEAAWWTIKQAHEKKLLERGLRNVNWCPRCETAIADSEVEYADRTDDSIYVKFPLKDQEGFLVIWTTTPWTIPANMGVAANKDFTYALVHALPGPVLEEASLAAGLDPAALMDKHSDGTPKPMRFADKVARMKEAIGPEKLEELYAAKGEKLIIAVDLVEGVMKLGRYGDYRVLKTMQGEELKGTQYRHPLEDLVPCHKGTEHKVYLADFVVGENTGLVHIAPGHGLDDFELGVKEGIPVFCPVKPNGAFAPEAGAYAGMNIRDANPKILDDLRARGLLLGATEITHRYGHCWRCKTPIIFMTTDQWFIAVSKIKEPMLAEVSRVNWYPPWAGSSRFHDWVSGARDWCISRQRYWGIPIPIWKCENCGSMDVIGTKEELEHKTGVRVNDLHRPFVDSVYMECECGGRMKRVEDIFDVWFDSAVASWATLRFPQRKDLMDWWPADFIVEGHDQTRGWFYSQLGAGMVGFGKAPYNSVCMHGFTLDDQGRKMSKSLGNVVAPEEVLEKFGADALRLYVLSQSAPWEDLSFSWDECGNVYRTLNIFWNVYRFPLPYMVLDKFDPTKTTYGSVKEHLRVEDRWILSRLQAVIKEVNEGMATYELHRSTRALINFILEDLSRWYVQLSRERTWVEANDPDKLAAYWVLYHVLSNTVKLMAPYTPYMAERMYQNLVRNSEPSAWESVHMCEWPTVNASLLDEQLNKDMDVARKIVEASSNARQKAKRKLRWPVKKITVAPDTEETATAVKDLTGVIREQTNAKEIVLLGVGAPNPDLGVEVVPNPKVIGPAFKGEAGKVIGALKSSDGRVVKSTVEKDGRFVLTLAGGEVEVTPDMVSFRDVIPETLAMGEFPGGKLYVDVELTPELEAEGYTRELIRRIQDMRKDLKLNVEDKIKAEVYVGDDRVRGLVAGMNGLIMNEVRASGLEFKGDKSVSGALVKEWDVEGLPVTIGIEKA
ncbi:isoleucyl-tRNA synthetase [Methanocella paludicola SANAE]|uniref:Isoleucine--tRNA ligase n=1 Tax=Methanocella paludicola (strain DSM 17711 / JCM 13418 / NBRC 101707 / SANAE) TaxID=304371 RepID=D1YV20_METPS|nr:isoleucine--tRNA ligase [Methanocella paludicola]BAI60292.1 isoleucyl-tRNA synthetase [Methanocella paludicola SANAE]